MKFTTKGLIAPVFTPFQENGDLNLSVIPKYADLLFEDKSLTGILVNGTSGEGMSMTPQERKAVTESWLQVIKEKGLVKPPHVMIQVGGTSLPDTLDLARHAAAHQVDSILCLPELYIKPRNCSELLDYLSLVSKVAPNTPLLYYHIPMFTNVNIHMGQFLQYVRENAERVPTFAGIKFTSYDLDEGYDALKSGYSVFLGADTLMLSASHLGFDSTIAVTLNFYSSKIMNQSVSNEERQRDQLDLIEQIKIITKHGCGQVPSMKAAMKIISQLDCGPVRPPMRSLTKQQVETMAASLLAKTSLKRK